MSDPFVASHIPIGIYKIVVDPFVGFHDPVFIKVEPCVPSVPVQVLPPGHSRSSPVYIRPGAGIVPDPLICIHSAVLVQVVVLPFVLYPGIG